MNVLIWAVFVLAVLVWTGFAALVAQAIAWSSDRLSTGAVGTLEMATNQIGIPRWASAWSGSPFCLIDHGNSADQAFRGSQALRAIVKIQSTIEVL